MYGRQTCLTYFNLTQLLLFTDRDIVVAFFFKSRSIWICQTRSIQSGEKERTDLSGHSGGGHLVLVYTERHRPRLLLQVNKLRRRPAAQMGVAKSDFSQMHRNRSDLIMNVERFARIDLDQSRFEKERNPCIDVCCSGLLSGHLMATELQKSHNALDWYKGELLHMAHDVGNRLLPAFNTSTGMPFPRVHVSFV